MPYKNKQKQLEYQRKYYKTLTGDKKKTRIQQIKRSEYKRSAENKIKLITLKGGKCFRCKQTVHPAAFQFHHTGNKEEAISRMFRNGLGFKKILKEAEQCELVCANCHHIIHYAKKYDALVAKLDTALPL